MAIERPSGGDSLLKRALTSGSRLTGSSGGAAVGVVIGGPAGAAAGGAVGWAAQALIDGGTEISEQHLAPRAAARIGALFRMVDGEVSARLMAGEEPRDELREEVTAGRSAAAELVEAALIVASQTFEERKLPFLAHLLAAILFEPDLDNADANQLIAIAESLSYRQLVLLAVYDAIDPKREGRNVMGGFHLRGETMQPFPDSETLVSIRIDLLDLFRRGLISAERRSRRVGRHSSEDLPWPAIPAELSPDAVVVSVRGGRLVRLMRLGDVQEIDREKLVLTHLRWPDDAEA